jgi:hypothetical protein
MMRAEKLHDLVAHGGIVSTLALDERRLIVGVKIERGIEHGIDASIAIVR